MLSTVRYIKVIHGTQWCPLCGKEPRFPGARGPVEMCTGAPGPVLIYAGASRPSRSTTPDPLVRAMPYVSTFLHYVSTFVHYVSTFVYYVLTFLYYISLCTATI